MIPALTILSYIPGYFSLYLLGTDYQSVIFFYTYINIAITYVNTSLLGSTSGGD